MVPNIGFLSLLASTCKILPFWDFTKLLFSITTSTTNTTSIYIEDVVWMDPLKISTRVTHMYSNVPHIVAAAHSTRTTILDGKHTSITHSAAYQALLTTKDTDMVSFISGRGSFSQYSMIGRSITPCTCDFSLYSSHMHQMQPAGD